MAKKTKTPGSAFPSEIKKPLSIFRPKGWLFSDDNVSGADVAAEAEKQINDETYRKLNALLEHYGISVSNPDKWRLLCLFLVDELGLLKISRERGRGRPRKDYQALVAKVDEIKTARRCGTLDAIRSLIKAGPYKGSKLNTLRNHYMDAKRGSSESLLAILDDILYMNGSDNDARKFG